MKVHLTFIFFLFMLQGGNSGLLNAGQHRIITGIEGGNITVECSFTFPRGRKFFCKQECAEGALVQTTRDRAENGRFSIEYNKKLFLVLPYAVLYVSITQLTRSDSGWYRCGLDGPLSLDSQEDFEIIVTDAPATSKPNWTLHHFSASVPSASTSSTTHSLSSNSVNFTSLSASPETTDQSLQQQTERTATPTTRSGKLLYVVLILVIKIFLLSLAVLFFLCRRRASKHKEPSVETEYASVLKVNQAYEDIREDRQSRSPPVEISPIYTYAKFTKPKGTETSDDYSFALPNSTTAASFQHKAADDLSELIYAEVSFPGVSRGDANDVIFSVPRVEASSDGSHKEDASPPLYSTITLPQQ